ncbi:CD151 antigen-like [Venturia canescens]|uniref:CD151 antigen-like n=1 Tax=Venturia canescens TaxID=32260 RepID=UPI001C9CCF28|nr:CD151 antigen-like [Venturia canescens]
MSLWNILSRYTMKRSENANEEESEDTETVDDDATDSEHSAMNEKLQIFGLPIYKLSYKQLPRKCIKFSFLLLNGGAFLAGITATIISIWMLADTKLMSRLVGQKLFVTTLLLIGLFSSSVAFIGILAFVKRRKKFLLIYITSVSMSLGLIFVCGILSFTFFEEITKRVRDDMVNSIGNYRSLDWVTEAWDNTHKYLKCCGIKSIRDWHEYRIAIPQSCCSVSIDKCLTMTEDVAYRAGCLRSAVSLLKSHIPTVALLTLFTAITLIASLFFALGVNKRFRMYRSSDV